MFIPTFARLSFISLATSISGFASAGLLLLLLWTLTRPESALKAHPINSLLLFTAILFGVISFWHTPWHYATCGITFCSLGLLLLVPPAWRSLGAQLALLALISGARFTLLTIRHELIKTVLWEQPRAIHGYIDELEPWATRPGGVIATLTVTHIDHQAIATRLRFYLHAPDHYDIGDHVYLSRLHLKQLLPPHKARLDRSLAREEIAATFFMPRLYESTLEKKSFYYCIKRFWHYQRRLLYERLRNKCSPEMFTYFSALFFGNKQTADYTSVKDVFSRWGITHYLARSGLHIVILIMLWSMLFGLVPLPFWLKNILLLVLLYVYSMMSWASLSFYRAVWLFVLYSGALFLRRRPATLHLFSIATATTLIISPLYAFFLDFQLSFGLTLVLLVLGYYSR